MNFSNLKAFLILGLVVGVAAPMQDASAFGRRRSKQAPGYAGIKVFMKDLAQKYPSTTQIFQLGMSDSGEMIEGLRIGNGPVHNLLVATHHGNEYGSTEVAKAFAKSIAAAPIAGQTLFVIPVLNISGYNARQRRESARGTTFDPNRDYPGPCGTEGPFALKSTHALADLLANEQIVTSATLHTSHPAVLYPWGFGTHDLATAYDDLYIQLGQASAVESQYPVGNSTAMLYPAAGAYEDYAFWKHGIWSLLFELGYTHTPTQAQVDDMIRGNVPGLRRYYEQAPRQRAENHDFTGRCDNKLYKRDKHDE